MKNNYFDLFRLYLLKSTVLVAFIGTNNLYAISAAWIFAVSLFLAISMHFLELFFFSLKSFCQYKLVAIFSSTLRPIFKKVQHLL